MSEALPWLALFDAVVDAFAEDAVPAENDFGWRAPQQQPKGPTATRARISWVPGDDKGGKAGKYEGAISPGQTPQRSLGTFRELFTIYIHAVDHSSKTAAASDRAQYRAARNLHDNWWRCFYNAAYSVGLGNRLRVEDSGWVADKRVAPNGACLRLLVSLPAKLPDAIVTIMPTEAVAVLEGHLSGTTDDPDTDENEAEAFDSTDPETIRTDEP